MNFWKLSVNKKFNKNLRFLCWGNEPCEFMNRTDDFIWFDLIWSVKIRNYRNVTVWTDSFLFCWWTEPLRPKMINKDEWCWCNTQHWKLNLSESSKQNSSESKATLEAKPLQKFSYSEGGAILKAKLHLWLAVFLRQGELSPKSPTNQKRGNNEWTGWCMLSELPL